MLERCLLRFLNIVFGFFLVCYVLIKVEIVMICLFVKMF